MRLLKQILPYLICFVFGILLLNECSRDPEIRTVTKTITVPEVVKQFDTIIVAAPIYVHSVDTVYINKFIQSDSTGRLDLYKNAITIREYNQTFKDSTASINVYSKTRGLLLAQSIDYQIFER